MTASLPKNRRVLRNAGNQRTVQRVSDGTKTKKKSNPIISETRWRKLILEYYDADEFVSAFLKRKSLSQHRMQFDTRWNESGLKNLKKMKEEHKTASRTYDDWMVKRKEKRTITEDEWRHHILSYCTKKENKSLSKYVRENHLSRDKFRKRWEGSKLAEVKAKNLGYKEAKAQYNSWFLQWRGQIIEKNRINRFQIFVDAEVSECDGEDHCKERCKGEGEGEDDNVNNFDVDSNRNDTDTVKGEDDSVSNFDVDSNRNDTDTVNIRDKDGDREPSNTVDDDDGGDGDSSTSYNQISSTRKKMYVKLPAADMREYLYEYYLCKDEKKLLVFMKEKGLYPHRNAMFRHFKESGLEQLKNNRKSPKDAFEQYDQWLADRKKIAALKFQQNGVTTKVIPEDLERYIHGMIKQMALCGQGIGKKIVRQILQEALQKWDSHQDRALCRSTLERFVKRYDLECKSVKNIDPVRISQVSPENRDAFFFRLDQVVSLLHDHDPINCPWKSWKEVDSRFIDNMDEMGTDSTKHRDLLLIPKEVTHRLFQSTPEGDRPKTHITLAVFSKANGHYKNIKEGIDGAPMPVVIHTDKNSKDKGATPIEKRIALYGDGEDDGFVCVHERYTEGFDPENPLGITVRSSTNGSMTKELFLDTVLHYVKHFADDQGPTGKYTFLLLDSHVSRWHPKALFKLFECRVIPIYFPSHLSIVCQPQDNGVILFLHACIEEASVLNRLCKSSVGLEYANSVLEQAFYLFREGERRKLLDHGSNSTTRSYRVPGIKPCDPFSIGWRENLELYASFNAGIRITQDPCPNYGVKPKSKNACREFTEEELIMLNDAVPILAKEDGVDTILDAPRVKCYTIANDIINNWIGKPSEERTGRPRPTNHVERLALEQMEIVSIVCAETPPDSLLLESNCQQRKRDAILQQTSKMETIQIKPKGNEVEKWHIATKMEIREDMWSVFDGEDTTNITSKELDENWDINLKYDMFRDDMKLRDKKHRSDLRRRNEKDSIIHKIAKDIAEEEREAELRELYEKFMAQPQKDYATFKSQVVTRIEHPSRHTVNVKIGTEDHVITTSAHGNNVSTIEQTVLDTVCNTLYRAYNKHESKKTKRRRGGKVARTRRGSDGFVKIAQIDEQHQLDLLEQSQNDERKKKIKIKELKRRYSYVQKLENALSFGMYWREDEEKSLDLESKEVTKTVLTDLLKVFNVDGRTDLTKGGKKFIVEKFKELQITRRQFEEIEMRIKTELQTLGVNIESDLNQSFGNDSMGGEFSAFESERSAVESNIESNIDSDVDSINTAKLIELLNKTPKKSVSFDDNPTVQILSPEKNSEATSATLSPDPTPTPDYSAEPLPDPTPAQTTRSSRRKKKQIPLVVSTRRKSNRKTKKTWKLDDR